MPKLLDELRARIRRLNYSIRTQLVQQLAATAEDQHRDSQALKSAASVWRL